MHRSVFAASLPRMFWKEEKLKHLAFGIFDVFSANNSDIVMFSLKNAEATARHAVHSIW